MLNEADLRDGAAATDALPAEGALDTPRTSRRLLLGGSLAALGLAAGGLPRLSVISPAAAQGAAPAAAPPKGPQPFDYPGKDKGLVLLGDRPLVAETPESLLDDDTTPIAKFFVRNNGQIPEPIKDVDGW